MEAPNKKKRAGSVAFDYDSYNVPDQNWRSVNLNKDAYLNPYNSKTSTYENAPKRRILNGEKSPLRKPLLNEMPRKPTYYEQSYSNIDMNNYYQNGLAMEDYPDLYDEVQQDCDNDPELFDYMNYGDETADCLLNEEEINNFPDYYPISSGEIKHELAAPAKRSMDVPESDPFYLIGDYENSQNDYGHAEHVAAELTETLEDGDYYFIRKPNGSLKKDGCMQQKSVGLEGNDFLLHNEGFSEDKTDKYPMANSSDQALLTNYSGKKKNASISSLDKDKTIFSTFLNNLPSLGYKQNEEKYKKTYQDVLKKIGDTVNILRNVCIGEPNQNSYDNTDNFQRLKNGKQTLGILQKMDSPEGALSRAVPPVRNKNKNKLQQKTVNDGGIFSKEEIEKLRPRTNVGYEPKVNLKYQGSSNGKMRPVNENIHTQIMDQLSLEKKDKANVPFGPYLRGKTRPVNERIHTQMMARLNLEKNVKSNISSRPFAVTDLDQDYYQDANETDFLEDDFNYDNS